MGLFSKEVECENCNTYFLKKSAAKFEIYNYYDKKRKQSIRVCGHCLMELFYEFIINYKSSLAIVSPYASDCIANFDFDWWLNFKDRQEGMESNARLINGFKSTLPEKGVKCEKCEKEAKHSFCESEIVYSNLFDWKFNETAKYQHLCPECLVETFKQTLIEKDIKITGYISVPEKGHSFLCNWEY